MGPDQVREGFVEAVGLLCTLKVGNATNRKRAIGGHSVESKDMSKIPEVGKLKIQGQDLPASADGSWGKGYGRTEKDKIKNMH